MMASKYSAEGREVADIWIVFSGAPAGLNSTIAAALCCATQRLPAPSKASAPGLDTLMSCCQTPSVVKTRTRLPKKSLAYSREPVVASPVMTSACWTAFHTLTGMRRSRVWVVRLYRPTEPLPNDLLYCNAAKIDVALPVIACPETRC